ncbi:uncharacterized protein UV8b_07556 [Ustilaginoidea virens]|uniref:Uncharacterized protein n=1 Tax=Ustilaginoidea virens TaxID=1159556 RepID=A0A8E5HX96_USTVR|nr:uncharacterized protein UV8b_07556 [Ustilaginoidea virens]QUC23315.1 hypothetical protein UV8b_07556 [Ustilaginoidea virens]
MKTCAAALSILSGLAMAAPAVRARDGVCQSFIYSSPQCCSTANGGFLSCQTSTSAADIQSFKKSCDGKGQAQCCTIFAPSQKFFCVAPGSE